MGIREVLSAPRSPWQRAYVERVIGSIRRECLDHVIVWDESSLRRIVASYLEYYHHSRTHLSLKKDSPEPRPVQQPDIGPVVSVRQVGGLHHRYAPPETTENSSGYPEMRRNLASRPHTIASAIALMISDSSYNRLATFDSCRCVAQQMSV
jgi:hypothetical protein